MHVYKSTTLEYFFILSLNSIKHDCMWRHAKNTPLFGIFTFDPSHETCLRNHNDIHILTSDQDTRQNMKYFDVE
jgi:hypothetical protein